MDIKGTVANELKWVFFFVFVPGILWLLFSIITHLTGFGGGEIVGTIHILFFLWIVLSYPIILMIRMFIWAFRYKGSQGPISKSEPLS